MFAFRYETAPVYGVPSVLRKAVRNWHMYAVRCQPLSELSVVECLTILVTGLGDAAASVSCR